MSAQAWLQIILTLLAIFLVSIPLGRYMARIVMGRPTKLDRIFDPIDNAIYFLIGRRVAGQAMTWRTYTIHMLVTNLAMAIIIYLVLSFQNWLPLNQLNFPETMSPSNLPDKDGRSQYALATSTGWTFIVNL